MPCFPSLLLYVACCPPGDVLSVEEAALGGCPLEHLDLRTEACCGPIEARVDWVLGQLDELGLGSGGEGLAERRVAFEILERLVRDYSLHSLRAWQALAAVTAKDAVVQAEELKAEWAEALSSEETRGEAMAAMPSMFQRSVALSRSLAKAALRLEDLQQFVVGKRAVEEFKDYDSVSLDEVRGIYGAALEQYKSVIKQHDYLAFQVIPRIQMFLGTVPQVDPSAPVVNLLFLSMGKWARSGIVTLWSLLQHRSVPLRVFVLGDPEGLDDWHGAIEELRSGASAAQLQDVVFEYVDYAASERFHDFRRRYPKGCEVDEIGWALLARVLCHELLPSDVDRVIALDAGDVLVFEDIRGLWDHFQRFEGHHLLAAPFVAALHHVSAGAVLYNTGRMRQHNFTAIALRAARDALRRSGDCIHDQSLLNTLHLHRAEHGYAGPSPIMILPCRWMLVPSTEWRMHWNQPERWLPELVERRRYPGLISVGRMEVYCPDTVDMLSAWAWLVLTQGAQHRLRRAALDEGRLQTRYCAAGEGFFADPDEARCCRCGEGAALVHIPGDMKTWPLVSALLRMHSPPWKEWSAVGAASDSLTRGFWLRKERRKIERRHQRGQSPAIAAAFHLEVCFDDDDTGRKCCALQTRRLDSLGSNVAFQTVNLEPSSLPLEVWVETTAPHSAHLLLGQGPHDAIEVVLGAGGGSFSIMQWLVFGGPPVKLAGHEGAPQQRPTGATAEGEPTAQFRIALGNDGKVEVNHADASERQASWGVYLPELFMEPLRTAPLGIYVGTPPDVEASWVVCKA